MTDTSIAFSQLLQLVWLVFLQPVWWVRDDTMDGLVFALLKPCNAIGQVKG